jgi:1-acyl-sn-glycerol-3-phosphate acyltransferase
MIIVPIFTTSLFKRTSDLPHVMARHWAQFTLACADTKVEVTGKENIPAGPVIYMANHSSFFDVFAILGHLDVQFRWIVKKELFHIPLLGLAMKRSGYISIDRGNHEKAMESIDFAAEKIRSGTSIVIFPEGTRSEDDSLRYPFKKGGFHLAIRSNVPIVPITILGTRRILPKGGMIINPGTIKLVISKPIYPLHCQRVDSLMEEVYRVITLPMGNCSTVGSEFV